MTETNRASSTGADPDPRDAADWHRYLHQEGILVEDEGEECGPWHHRVFLGAASPERVAPPLDVRSPQFRRAVQAVFDAPGEWGPAKGYYGGDIDHFIDMLDARLSDTSGEPR
jgi:hypothetical protein